MCSVTGAECENVRVEGQRHRQAMLDVGMFCVVTAKLLKKLKQRNAMKTFLAIKVTRSSMENEFEETRLETMTSFAIIPVRN